MKRYFAALIVILILFIIESCSAPTYVTSWSDPNFKGKNVKKVLVIALVNDLDYRKAYEDALVKELKSDGVNALRSLEVLNFTKKYTDEEFGKLLNDGNYDGLLTVKYVDTDVKKRIHPSVTFFDYYWGTVYRYPAYVEKHKTVKMEVSLFSPHSRTPIWYATTKTYDAYGIDDLASSLADEITVNLSESGFIK